jgi:hypothetical protein
VAIAAQINADNQRTARGLLFRGRLRCKAKGGHQPLSHKVSKQFVTDSSWCALPTCRSKKCNWN